MKCPRCDNAEFLDDPTSHTNSWGVGRKYICSKCGFKGSKEMMKKGSIKKTFNSR